MSRLTRLLAHCLVISLAASLGIAHAATHNVGEGDAFTIQSAIGAAQNGDVGTREGKALQLFSSTPVAFIENTARVADPSVRYVFYGNGANVFHTTKGPVFEVFHREPQVGRAEAVGDPHPVDDLSLRSFSFCATFPGAKKINPVGEQRQQTQANYYIGRDQAAWRTRVPTFRNVVYTGLWDGIDLHTFGQRSHLKYEFHVAPGADWSKIVVRYEGITGLRVEYAGNLHVETSVGSLIDDPPYAYQIIDGKKKCVTCRYRIINLSTYSFEVDGGIDIAGELVIDPNLMWASFLGGNSSEGEDTKDTIAIDGAGNLFIAGFTNSSDFPTPGGFDTTLFVRLPGRQHLRRQPRRLVLLLLESLRWTLCQHRHHHPALLNCGTPLPIRPTGVPSGWPAAASGSCPTKPTPPRAGRTPAGEPAFRLHTPSNVNASAPHAPCGIAVPAADPATSAAPTPPALPIRPGGGGSTVICLVSGGCGVPC